ncbi:MAG: S8 family serine peptidase [Pseudomonadota bacterium]
MCRGRILFWTLGLFIVLTSACSKSSGSSNKPDNPTPTSGLNGTINFVRTGTDLERLARDPQDASWNEGEVILRLQDGVSDQVARDEITRQGGEIVKAKSLFPYYLVRSNDIRTRWRKSQDQAVTEWSRDGKVSDETLTSMRDVHRRTMGFVTGLKKRRHLFSRAAHNYIRKASATLNPQQWALSQMKLPAVWNQYGHGSSNVVVAVIDTGVRKNHPNLQGNLLWEDGYDWVNDQMDRDNEPGPDNNPEEPPTQNASFHGTHVAGIIAAKQAPSFPVDGIASGVKILPIRVLGEEGGTDFDIAQAILYAAGLLETTDGKKPGQRADIINLSLGGPGENVVLEDAIARATAAGVVVVVAAGNDGWNQPSYPAAYSQVIAVGALGPKETYASYSNYGGNVDVMAPGGGYSALSDDDGDGIFDGILSSWVRPQNPPNDKVDITYMSGTSMASPFVAGLVALMKSRRSELGLAEIRKAVFENASLDPLTGCEERCGRGGLNVADLLHTAETMPLSGAKIQLAQDWILPASGSSTAELRLTNSGSGRLELITGEEEPRVHAATSVNWLKVTATQDDRGILLKFNFDKSKLGNDAVAATVDVVTNAAEISISSKENGAPNRSGVLALTVGYDPSQTLDVVLIPTAGGDRTPISRVRASADGQFHFDPPAAGEYFLFAGRDDNGDGKICSMGDPCGAYPSLASPKRISISGTEMLTGLNFEVSSTHQSGLEIPVSASSGGGS